MTLPEIIEQKTHIQQVDTCKVKINVMSICIVPIHETSHETSLRHSGIARIVKGIRVIPAHPAFHPQAEWATPAFAFPAASGTHLPIHEYGRLSGAM